MRSRHLLTLLVLSTSLMRVANAENLLNSSGDLLSADWKLLNRNATVSKADIQDPDRGQNAFRLQITGGYIGQMIAARPGHSYVFSVWMKSATGETQKVSLAGENNHPAEKSSFVSKELDTNWRRQHIIFECPANGNYKFRFSIRAGDVYVWHPQVEDVTESAIKEPSSYSEIASKFRSIKPLVPQNPPPPGIVQNISCWGDSLTAGAGGNGNSYSSYLQKSPLLAGRKVSAFGVGGEKSDQIKARFMAAEDKFNDLAIIWAGRNNYPDIYAVEADIADMVGKLKTNRFLVLSIINMNTEPAGSSRHNAILLLNKHLASQYPDNFLDIRSALIEACDKKSPDDIADYKKNIPPKSFRSDGIHLNANGYKLVAEKIISTIQSKGWQ